MVGWASIRRILSEIVSLKIFKTILARKFLIYFLPSKVSWHEISPLSCGLDKVAILWDSATMTQKRVVMVGQPVGAAILLPSAPEDGIDAVSVLLGGETGECEAPSLVTARTTSH